MPYGRDNGRFGLRGWRMADMPHRSGHRPRYLGDPVDEAAVADDLAAGCLVGFGFGNFYALAARPDRAVVARANELKGRPADQVGSIVTTPTRLPSAFDWSALPAGLDRHTVLGLVDALLAVGPIGFRGPAADPLPDHLCQDDGGIRTTQVIAPGWSCPGNAFVAACLQRTGGAELYVTSANRSRHLSGAAEEPAHSRAEGLVADFGDALPLLRHPDEAAARARYPHHAPMSTTLVGVHRTTAPDADGRIGLVVERHGSLPLETAQRLVRPLGVHLVLGPRAADRLPQHRYDT